MTLRQNKMMFLYSRTDAFKGTSPLDSPNVLKYPANAASKSPFHPLGRKYPCPCINRDHLIMKEANTLLLLPAMASSSGLNTLQFLHCQQFTDDGRLEASIQRGIFKKI